MSTTIIRPTGPVPGDYTHAFPVETIDIITALQGRGYEVFEAQDMPEVIEKNGKPTLPIGIGERTERNEGKTKSHLYYEEALGKLALARWWEKEEERIVKRRAGLAGDIEAARAILGLVASSEIADYLLKRGWKR